jgi:hypothetical protein
MQIINDKRNRYANRLIALVLVYIVLKVIGGINWTEFLLQPNYENYESAIELSNLFNLIRNILLTICIVLIYLAVKKLRETEKTKKLYNILFWIIVGTTVFSYLFANLSTYYLQAALEENLHRRMGVINAISKIQLIIVYLLPLPVYIAILVKEKLNYNWMIIGSVSSLYFMILTRVIYWARDFLT